MNKLIPTFIFSILFFSGCASTQVKTPKNFMVGTYSYMADAAIFKECVTGKSYPVAFEEDSISLERAYLKAKRVAGEPLKVHLDAEIVYREGVDNQGLLETLIVKRFIKITPKESCKNSLKKKN